MTTFEFFKNQYDSRKEYAIKRINPTIEVDSFQFVKVASKCCFGGTYEWGYNNKVNRPSDFDYMIENKLLGKREYTNWQARQLGRTECYFLTAKGLKEFYKEMF